MNENTQEKAMNKLALKVASAELASSQWEALYEEEAQSHQITKGQLAQFQAVLESDTALKELFEETQAHMMEDK